MTKRIAYTFSSLTKQADFNATTLLPKGPVEGNVELESDEQEEDATTLQKARTARTAPSGLRTEFHYNLQIHLPANGTEETYLNIFNALRKIFQ